MPRKKAEVDQPAVTANTSSVSTSVLHVKPSYAQPTQAVRLTSNNDVLD